ncbi:hypothetical protein LMG29542_02461 [Paraburkholderia humisilvae]|uniref:Uncharacterized protein n=1 Tax=Paraburkholderia humisilvae TaxID=627669 RepID=A0A6J5DMS2_9BURK|nr:hypothetical protein LMG29542_02461 [Paraburkholderia humisilvae]
MVQLSKYSLGKNDLGRQLVVSLTIVALVYVVFALFRRFGIAMPDVARWVATSSATLALLWVLLKTRPADTVAKQCICGLILAGSVMLAICSIWP